MLHDQTFRWRRAGFMLFFWLVKTLLNWLTGLIAVLQFLHVLWFNRLNQRLMIIGQLVARFWYQVADYLVGNSDAPPFPFSRRF